MSGLLALGLVPGLATFGFSPGPASLGIGATTVVAACSMAAVGVAGLFGGGSDDDGDLSGIARRLDAREDPARIERRLDDLEDAIDALVADADLNRHLRDPPAADASSVEKAQALTRAVEVGQLSVGPSSTGGRSSSDDAGAVTSAATRLQRDLSPSSPAARQLLERVSAPERTDSDEVETIFERAVAALDTQHALERALAEVDTDEFEPGDARRVRDRLGHPDNEATTGVRRLARAAETYHDTAERQETEQESVTAATDVLTAAAADESDLDVGPDSGRPVGERLRVLADAVDRDELGFTDGDGGRVRSVAGEVRRSMHPESAVAKRLLDRLASPGVGDLRPALNTAVEQLDAASTTQSIVADLDRETVRDLADDVASDLDTTAGPVADAVAERVADLHGMLDRADESNAVIPYAVRHELRFYDRTLLSQLGGSGGSGLGDGSAGTRNASGNPPDVPLDSVADRREDVEDRYVDGRRDHNHSIPLHFLSLVDALYENAEQAAAVGDADRAAGLCSAADETLDFVEQLYERNEYSVMLRRLRG